MALASSGPTQSIAVGIVGLMVAVTYHTFLPILICFIPMIGIAFGYQRLNAWQPSAGATYSWVGRALNPHAGFFVGWIMLMYYTIGTTSLTVPLGTYFLTFFSNSRRQQQIRRRLVGSLLNILVLVVAALGIKLSARFNWVWAVFEYALMIGFSIVALVMIYSTGLSGSVHTFSSLFTLPKSGLITGLLIAIFLYSGWDTAAYVGEEAKGKQAGSAAILSVVILFVIYSFVIFAFQGVASFNTMQGNEANILAFVGDKIGGSFWKNVMIVAVLGGTLASLQAAIVSSGRISFAMGRDRVFPKFFDNVHPRYRTPWNATILLGLLNVVFLWGTTLFSSIGTRARQHREHTGHHGGDLLPHDGVHGHLVLPQGDRGQHRQPHPRRHHARHRRRLHGASSSSTRWRPAQLTSTNMIFGFGLALVGLVLSFISAGVGHAKFYTDPSTSFGDKVDAAFDERTAQRRARELRWRRPPARQARARRRAPG